MKTEDKERQLQAKALTLYHEILDFVEHYQVPQNTTDVHKAPRLPDPLEKKFRSFLNDCCFLLLDRADTFYAHMYFQMEKVIRLNLPCPTSLTVKHAKYVVYINPLLYLPLTVPQMLSALQHEVLHIISMHLPRAKELERTYSHIAVTLAMNVTVNNYLPNISDNYATLGWVNNHYTLALKPFKTLDYYVREIQKAMDRHAAIPDVAKKKMDGKESPMDMAPPKELSYLGQDTDSQAADQTAIANFDMKPVHSAGIIEEFGAPGHTRIEDTAPQATFITSQSNPFHNHDSWSEGDSLDDEDTIYRLTESMVHSAALDESSPYLSALIADFAEQKVQRPWYVYLKKLLGSVMTKPKRTPVRKHRRQPDRLDLLGHLRNHKAKIFIAIDNSGSITNSAFKKALEEVCLLLHAQPHSLTIIECDNEVRRSYTVERPCDLKERLPEQGGTAFSPVIEYCNERKPDLLLYITDGKGENRLSVKPKGYQILWLLSSPSAKLSLMTPYGLIAKLPPSKDGAELEEFEVGCGVGGFSMANQEKL